MDMWAGTNRIGFDSLDSLSSPWLEFHSMSPLTSHFKMDVGGVLCKWSFILQSSLLTGIVILLQRHGIDLTTLLNAVLGSSKVWFSGKMWNQGVEFFEKTNACFLLCLLPWWEACEEFMTTQLLLLIQAKSSLPASVIISIFVFFPVK